VRVGAKPVWFVSLVRQVRLQNVVGVGFDAMKQENSAKLTNQRVSCAYTSSPFSFHVRNILPTSKFQNSCSCIYRAMHFSANARSWDRMSSVCLSVRDVGEL